VDKDLKLRNVRIPPGLGGGGFRKVHFVRRPRRRRAGKWRSHCTLPFQKGAAGVEVPFHNSIIGHFIVYQDRLETYFLQVFVHPESSGWFSVIYVILESSTLFLRRNKHNW